MSKSLRNGGPSKAGMVRNFGVSFSGAVGLTTSSKTVAGTDTFERAFSKYSIPGRTIGELCHLSHVQV